MKLEKQQQRDLMVIFALGIGFRLALLLLFSVPYGNDAAGRLYFRDTIWTWHWLPVTQFLVYGGFALTHSIFVVRLLFALIGSLAAVAFTFYLQKFATRRAAVIGGVLFTLNAQLVFLSLMPYQEVVLLGLLFGFLSFFMKDEEPANGFLFGSLLYGLACLTRYEAWFVLPALFIARVWQGKPKLLRVFLTSVIGFGWGPALWLFSNWMQWGDATAFLFHRSDQQFYAWAPHAELLRIIDYLGMMSYWLLRFGSPLILFALPGMIVGWRNRKILLPQIWPVLLLFGMVLLFLIFVAGKEFAGANRFASIPLAIMLIFTALGADYVLARVESRWRDAQQMATIKKWGAALLLLALLVYGALPVAKANALPEFRTPHEVAQFLQQNLRSGERAIVIGESIDGAVPMPYQRIYGQLKFAKQDLLCAALLEPRELADPWRYLRAQNVRYVIVFGGSWQKQENDFKLLNFITASEGVLRPVFARDPAVIYEVPRSSSLKVFEQ